MSAVEGYTLNSTAGNSAPVGGRRGRKSRATKRKLRALKKQIKKLGGAAAEVKEAIGGAEEAVEKTEEAVSDMAAAPMGARRRRGRRGTKKTRRSGKHRRSLFGLKY
jgi:hypothetical protein